MAASVMTNQHVLDKLNELYEDVFAHDGFGEIRIEFRILHRGQKEVILHCGKQHRYVIDFCKKPLRKTGCQDCGGCESGEDDTQQAMPAVTAPLGQLRTSRKGAG